MMGGWMKTYRDLIVWQKAMDFVKEVYRYTKDFPKEESYGLTMQVRRSSVSIPSNIAEGYGRRSTGDYQRFLQIAMGSVFEAQTQIEISFNLGYMSKDSFEKIYESSREIERMLSSLCEKIRQ